MEGFSRGHPAVCSQGEIALCPSDLQIGALSSTVCQAEIKNFNTFEWPEVSMCSNCITHSGYELSPYSIKAI